MKIDFNQKIMNLDGTAPLKKGDSETYYLLGDAAAEVLLVPEQGTDGLERAKRGALAIDIARRKGVMDLPIEDVALIKKRIGEVMGPLVVTQAWPMLEKVGEEKGAD